MEPSKYQVGTILNNWRIRDGRMAWWRYTITAKNPDGNNEVRFEQWDGEKWVEETDGYAPLRFVIDVRTNGSLNEDTHWTEADVVEVPI
jgi:hypothetical protein